VVSTVILTGRAFSNLQVTTTAMNHVLPLVALADVPSKAPTLMQTNGLLDRNVKKYFPCAWRSSEHANFPLQRVDCCRPRFLFGQQ